MAVEVGSAYISIVPSFRNFNTSIKSSVASAGKDIEGGLTSAAERGGSQAGDRAGSSFLSHVGGALKTTGALVAGVAAAVGTAGVALSTVGIKSAAAWQQNQIAFETLLGSTDKAKKFMGDLSTFAARTPFTMPGLVDASRQLIGVGASADSVIPTLTAFGDASGALGLSQDQFNHIMLATTQAMANGKIQAGDMLQITQAGLPIWSLLSKALGKPVSEVRKLSEQGKLLTADVLPKLQAEMEKDYGGAMAKQSLTLTGLWSTLTDTIQMGLGRAFIPLTPIFGTITTAATNLISNGLGKLSDWMANTAVPWMLRFGQEWKNNVTGSFGGETRQVLTAIAGAVTSLFSGTGGAQTAASLQQIGGAFKDAAPAVQQMLANLPSFNDVLSVSATVIKFLADHVDLLVKAMPYLVAAFVAYKAAQMAANYAEALSIPLRIAEIGVHWNLAAAMRANTAALSQMMGVEETGIAVRARAIASSVAQRVASAANAVVTGVMTAATWAYNSAQQGTLLTQIRAAAVTVALRAASIASTTATYAWTAAQWLLNAAMDANPIGLIVLAIAALVAGFILAYQHSSAFRSIVQGALTAVGAAAMWLWNQAIKPAFGFIMDHWKLLLAVFLPGVGLIVMFWGQLQTAALYLWNNVLKPTWDAMMAGIQILGSVFVWLYQNIVQPIWTGIQLAIAVAWALIQVTWGLIQIGVQLLADVFVWLYQNVVQPVWSMIALAVQVAWALIQVTWGLIQIGIQLLGELFVWLYQNVVLPVWNQIKQAIALAWAAIQIIWSVVKAEIGVLGSVFSWLYTNVVLPVWGAIKQAIAVAWSGIQVIWEGIKIGLNALGAVFHWLNDNAVQPAWHAIQAAVQFAWNNVISPVFEVLKAGMARVGDAFNTSAAVIGRAWDAIKEAAKTPVRFLINTVVNQGIIDNYNALARKFSVNTVDHVSLPAGFRTGGLIQGPGTGTSDSILAAVTGGPNIRVSNGEYVVPAHSVQQWGVGFFDWIAGKRRKPRRPGDGSEGLAFAGGGLVDFAGDVWDLVTNPSKLLSGITGVLGGIPGGGDFRQAVIGAGKSIVDGFKHWITNWGGSDTGGLVAKTQAFLRAQNGKPYIWAAAGPEGYDCSGLVSAAWNMMHGRNPYAHTFSTESEAPFFPLAGHGVFTAGWSHPGQRGGGDVGHTAGNLAGLGFESTGDHVRIGSATTGVDTFANIGHFDNGGLLPFGDWLVSHRRREPDRVLTDAQWRTAERAMSSGSGRQIVVNIHPRAEHSEADVAAQTSRELAWLLN